MYLNRATLIGYLGNDVEVRNGKNNQKFTTFSVATKTSYKDKASGEYISHTEWHRCIVFGKFVRVTSILKLDRAEKASADEQEFDEMPAEEEAE
jgi:single-strand DNA-binding protein